MEKFLRNTLSAGLLMLGATSTANAALIDSGSFTTDTSTGLDWLDLTETVSTSYDYVSSQLGEGGEFEGWALASRSQVLGLLDNAGGSGAYLDWSTENNGVVTPLLDLWGDFSTDAQNNSVHFLFDEVNEFDQHRLAYLFDTTKSTEGLSNDLMRIDHGFWGSSPSTQVGSALVRVSAVPVPVPAAVWLFGSGLIGLIGFARRKK
jgi:hypothetical protein